MKYLLLFIALSSVTLNAQTQKMEPLVSVIGEGNVKVIPDGVTIKVRVESEGEEAQMVKNENDIAIDKVIKFLKSQNVPTKNVKTEYINLNKNYNYQTKIYKYTANQTLSIKLEDLSEYESIMSGLLNSGINRIDGVQFTSSQMETLKEKARINAILNAKEKAQTYATTLGQTIGKAVQISEQASGAPQPPIYQARMMSMESDSSGGETIAPGELSISYKVYVSFQLN